MTTPLGQVTGELQSALEFVTYGAVGGDPTISSTQKYTGGYSVRYGIGGNKAAGVTFTAASGVRLGAWLHHNGVGTLTNNKAWLFVLLGGATVRAEVYWDKDNVVSLAVGGSVVATATYAQCGLDQLATWKHVGLVYITGVAGSCTFYVDGVAVLTYTGTITGTVDAAYCGGAKAVNGWASYAYFDDFYIDGGIVTDEAPPADRFLFSGANGAGADSEWTPTGAASNYECVDDPTGPDGDTSYVLATWASLQDLYATANITLPANYAIKAAIPVAMAMASLTGPTLQLVASDGVSADQVSAVLTPGSSYGYVMESMATQPDGSAWNEADFNAMQFGLKSGGTY